MAPFRRRRHALVPFLGLLILCGVLALPSWGVAPRPSPAAAPQADARPRLAVLVVFDQMRGDYLSRWQELFGADGFRRLEHDGAWFQDCHYPYADTVTAVGHASVLTGCSPQTHGIIANEWYDRAAGTTVYCVSSDRYQRVPPPGKEAPKKPSGVSPDRLLAPTLGDALRAATGGRGRVVSLSFKDRSAVLPAGHRPDACYWLDTNTGTFVTSTYYRDRLHPWVEEFNRERPADRWFGRDWTRLRTDVDYARFSGPDDVVGEGAGLFRKRTFPHPLSGEQDKPGPGYYQALYTSPFGNELLLDLAERAIDAEELGRHADPDLLCLSFSCNDPIGHVWGPDSQEVLDVTLRSDLVVRELLAYLDAHVGKGRYLLALTADHGVCPLPEVTQARGEEAGRVSPDQLQRKASAFLDMTFGPAAEKGRWIEAQADAWLYLNQKLLRQRGLASTAVEEALAGWLKKQPGIQAAYTRGELLRGVPADDALGQAVRRSFFPERSGDVAVVLKPHYLFSSLLMATTHGTPHDYDTHVPLLVFGPGIRAGVRQDRVPPQAAAAILAHGLGIAPPAHAEAPVPAGLFTSPGSH
jgi:hypothetical protein